MLHDDSFSTQKATRNMATGALQSSCFSRLRVLGRIATTNPSCHRQLHIPSNAPPSLRKIQPKNVPPALPSTSSTAQKTPSTKGTEPSKSKYSPIEVPSSLPSPGQPYHVARTASKNLPVYLLTKRGGNLKQTLIRHVTGDVGKLSSQLQGFLGIEEKDCLAKQLEGHVVLKVCPMEWKPLLRPSCPQLSPAFISLTMCFRGGANQRCKSFSRHANSREKVE